MTKTEFINSLNFEVAKNTIAKKLGIKADELVIKPYKSGEFKINLNNISGKIGSILAGGRAILVTERVNIKEHKDNFSYDASLMLNLKNQSGEYKSKIGKISLNKDKFVFYTTEDIKKLRKQRNTEEIIEETKAV